MNNFTYQKYDDEHKLEVFEWDNIWWEHTENKISKRICYIGDSISCGIRGYITGLSNSQILCDGFGTSKALDNPYFKPSLELFLRQQQKCDAILFNNGLHGWHLSDADYEKYFDDMLQFLSKTSKSIYVVLTTDENSDYNRNERVKARNIIAVGLAKKHHFPYIDLYKVAISNTNYHTQDGVHFNSQGYEILAKHILENLF